MATVFMSMAAKLSDIDDQKSGVILQTEGHTLTPPSGQNGPENPEAFGSTPSCSPSQSPARKLTPDWPKTWYCLEIQVISTEDERVTPPPPHAWQAPIVEDMVQDGKASLTEAIVTGPGLAVLFYGWQLLGEGLSLGETWDTAFTLLGAISWIGKQAQLSTKPVSLGNGWWLISQAIMEGHIKPRGPGHLIPPHLHQHHLISIIKTCLHDQPTSCQLLNDGRSPGLAPNQDIRNEVGCHSKGSTEAKDNELWEAPPQLPMVSSDHGFESDRSSASTSLSVASMSERLGGSRHPCRG